jgi:hypothetical protein
MDEKEESLVFLSIMSMRQYDVLLAILNEMNQTSAEKLNELHKNGGIISSMPYLNEDTFNEN